MVTIYTNIAMFLIEVSSKYILVSFVAKSSMFLWDVCIVICM